MKEIKGNIFDFIGDGETDAICITTNSIVKNDGCAVMGAGTAREARHRWFNITKCLGNLLLKYGNRTFFLGVILKDSSFKDPRVDKYNSKDIICTAISFPTKNDFIYKSDINLIKQSTIQLVELADHYNLKNIKIPAPGCGANTGQLNFEKDVKPVIEPLLDDRFFITFLD